jgi:hypothetical protein
MTITQRHNIMPDTTVHPSILLLELLMRVKDDGVSIGSVRSGTIRYRGICSKVSTLYKSTYTSSSVNQRRKLVDYYDNHIASLLQGSMYKWPKWSGNEDYVIRLGGILDDPRKQFCEVNRHNRKPCTYFSEYQALRAELLDFCITTLREELLA